MKPDSSEPIYSIENREGKETALRLTDEQKETVRRITLGIEEVDETARRMAEEDVIRTLQNGHPLNRLITNKEGEIVGYVACEDFVPKEAYIKYLGTAGGTGRDLLKEIPAFLEYAKRRGYLKLNFHGWNKRLNRVMERYGFKRIRTDQWGGREADFYEKTIAEPKTEKQISEERRRAFEEKHIQELNRQYGQILGSFTGEKRSEKELAITKTFQILSDRLAGQENFTFGEIQKTILKLKLARHFQHNETVDVNTLFDAIIETPKFIATDRGSLTHLLEIHEQKTLQKIAEMRKQRAELTHKETLNPYSALLTSKSGKYYLARLLNMPHLEEESAYMKHCVGTSDSYFNRMKRGEIEILSFRRAPVLNPKTQRLEGDVPLLTIEYDPKNGVIHQIKKKNDGLLSPDDLYLEDLLDIFKRLPETQTDLGKPREIKKINLSELLNFEVKPYHLLTEKGEIHFRDFNPAENPFILKAGEVEITPDISREDAAKLLRIFEKLDFAPDEIARRPEEIKENTKAYVGPIAPGIFDKIQEYGIEQIYTSFPEGRIRKETIKIGGKDAEALIKEMQEKKIIISDDAMEMLKSKDFTTLREPESEILIHLKVDDLGLPVSKYPTIAEIYRRIKELGLELCPPETGPQYRLQYTNQPTDEWFQIGMKQITNRHGNPDVFFLYRDESGLHLDSKWTMPVGGSWSPGDVFVFRLCPRSGAKPATG
jgi:hypothetical protein